MTRPYEKPPGLTPEYGSQFQDASIVTAYRHREPYPEETFQILRELAGANLPRIADLGCGTGDLTIPLSQFAQHVDAVDLSQKMLDVAKRIHPDAGNISWIQGPAEKAPLNGPYDLITAADSVHWMNWDVLFAGVRRWLKPGGFFCVVGRWYDQKEWWNQDFQEIIDKYSTNKEFKKYDIVEELRNSGFVRIEGSVKTRPMAFNQSINDLIEAFHSRNGFSRDRMGELAPLFDLAAKKHLGRFTQDGIMRLQSAGHITWMTVL